MDPKPEPRLEITPPSRSSVQTGREFVLNVKVASCPRPLPGTVMLHFGKSTEVWNNVILIEIPEVRECKHKQENSEHQPMVLNTREVEWNENVLQEHNTMISIRPACTPIKCFKLHAVPLTVKLFFNDSTMPLSDEIHLLFYSNRKRAEPSRKRSRQTAEREARQPQDIDSTTLLAPQIERPTVFKEHWKLRQLLPDTQREQPIETQEIILGRQGRESGVSRKHVVVWRQRNKVFCKDYSTNGTFVNGKKIQKGSEICLSSGDRLSFGNQNWVVYKANQTPAQISYKLHHKNMKTPELVPEWGSILGRQKSEQVSQFHAKLWFEDQTLLIHDLSVNGTRVNGIKIDKTSIPTEILPAKIILGIDTDSTTFHDDYQAAEEWYLFVESPMVIENPGYGRIFQEGFTPVIQ